MSGSGTGDAAVPNSFGGTAITIDGEGKITSLAGVPLTYDSKGDVTSVAGSGEYIDGFQRIVGDGVTQLVYSYDGWNRSGTWSAALPGTTGWSAEGRGCTTAWIIRWSMMMRVGIGSIMRWTSRGT